MSQDSHPSRQSAPFPADDTGLTAVLAHSMLGTVTAIRGAIETALAHELTGPGRDSLLLMASRRLDFLTAQLHDLAAGVPGRSVVVDIRDAPKRSRRSPR